MGHIDSRRDCVIGGKGVGNKELQALSGMKLFLYDLLMHKMKRHA